jgi:hypothetical protein
MTENIEKLLERDMKLNIIVAKSEKINTFSSNISNIVFINLIFSLKLLGKKKKKKERK